MFGNISALIAHGGGGREGGGGGSGGGSVSSSSSARSNLVLLVGHTRAHTQKLQVSPTASPYGGDQTSGGGCGAILTSPNQLLRVVDVARRASTSSSNVNKSWQMEADGHANCVCSLARSLARSIASTEARRVESSGACTLTPRTARTPKAHAHKTHGNCLLRVARDSRAARGGENRDGLLRVRRWWGG